jgi:hypothetical protein
MQQKIKVCWKGGTPPEDLLTVEQGQIKVHLYTCNRSQLHALWHAAKQVLQSMPLTDVQPDASTVAALLSSCHDRAPEPSAPEPPQPQPGPSVN